jgi:hypothetical protein
MKYVLKSFSFLIIMAALSGCATTAEIRAENADLGIRFLCDGAKARRFLTYNVEYVPPVDPRRTLAQAAAYQSADLRDAPEIFKQYFMYMVGYGPGEHYSTCGGGSQYIYRYEQYAPYDPRIGAVIEDYELNLPPNGHPVAGLEREDWFGVVRHSTTVLSAPMDNGHTQFKITFDPTIVCKYGIKKSELMSR